MADRFSDLPTFSEDLTLRATIRARPRTFFEDWFIRKKTDGETKEAFLSRQVEEMSINEVKRLQESDAINERESAEEQDTDGRRVDVRTELDAL